MVNMILPTVCLYLLVAFARGQDDEIPDFDWDDPTELDDYVWADDGEFKWEVIGQERYNFVTLYFVNMTSQRWMPDEFCTQPVWWHIMGIAVPDEIERPGYSALFIGGENNNSEMPPGRNNYFNLVAASTANDTNMVAAYILQVPNQPIRFRDDPKQSNRREDNIIAYTWRWAYDNYTVTPDQTPFEVIARMPMTKAAKRGLDTIEEFCASGEYGCDVVPEKFFVMGASKRGWTTFSLAMVDQRVFAIAPLVFSLLKMEETVMRHFQTMGGAWSFAFGPYFNEDLTYHLTDDIAKDVLFKLEDPYRYRTRLSNIPKLLILASGDEFFFPSDTHQWWDDFYQLGPMYLMMNPNAEHVLFPHWLRIYRTIVGFALTLMDGEELPYVESTRINDEEGGTARMTVDPENRPENVRAMMATTIDEGERRDWRLVAGHPDREVHPVRWNETEFTEVDNGYECRVENDEVEWNGCFIEGTWEYDGFPMYLTTEVVMTPDTYPVEPCEGEDCYGYLV